MIPHIVLAALIGAPPENGTSPVRPTLYSRHAAPSTAGPRIALQMSDDVLKRNERVRVEFRTDVDAYITIMRVDTDGRVRVLFPRNPWDDNYARGNRNYSVETDGRHAFVVDDYPGQGYMFGIASADPFDYRPYVRGDHWDYRVIADGGRIEGDPWAALGDLIDHILPPHYVAYSYDVLPYYVEERYEYPRFLCYECHDYAAFPYWDPYEQSCVRFRIVMYDDPVYYPVRQFGGTRVVYTRPVRPPPRYVFKDRAPDDPYVIRERERPAPETERRPVTREPTPQSHDPRRIPAAVMPGRVDVRLPTGRATVPRFAPRRLDEESRERTADSARPPGRDARAPAARPAPQRDAPTRSLPQLERRDPRRDDPPARATTPPGGPDDTRRTPVTRPEDDRRITPPRSSPTKQTPPKTDPKRKSGS